MRKDLTTGNAARTLFVFAVPFFVSYFLQTLYGLADLFIIGRYNGAASITAVSVGGQVMHMLTVVLVGLAMGSTVMIGRAVGAKDRAAAAKHIGNTVTGFFVLSLLLTVLLLFLVNRVVSLMSTPAEAVTETTFYLIICFAGIPFITAYNIVGAVFRGLGDSRSPTYFIAVACVLNVALDFLLIGGFSMGAVGAALGTVISQAVSVMSALFFVRRRGLGVGLCRSDLLPDRGVIGGILKVGVPVSLQDWFIQFCFLLIMIIANRRGVDIAAAVGIVERIIGILFLIPSSMLAAVSAIVAQNVGANRHDRARATLRYALMTCFLCGACFALLFQFVSEPVIALFTDVPAVIVYGGQYLRAYVIDCMFAGIHFCFSGFFCAYGLSVISFVHNAVSAALIRVPGAYLASVLFVSTLYPMGLAAPLGSVLSDVICAVVFIVLAKKRHREWMGKYDSAAA